MVSPFLLNPILLHTIDTPRSVYKTYLELSFLCHKTKEYKFNKNNQKHFWMQKIKNNSILAQINTHTHTQTHIIQMHIKHKNKKNTKKTHTFTHDTTQK